MGKRYCYQGEGEKFSIGLGWWSIFITLAALWLWK